MEIIGHNLYVHHAQVPGNVSIYGCAKLLGRYLFLQVNVRYLSFSMHARIRPA